MLVELAEATATERLCKGYAWRHVQAMHTQGGGGGKARLHEERFVVIMSNMGLFGMFVIR